MKKLTIEQKAEAYDKALRYATIYYNNGNADMKTMMSTCFPELKEKESEDEKIRKEIIEYIKTGTYHKNWIAWLEKQGTPYTQRDVDDAYLKGVTNTKNEIEKQYEASYQIRKDIATFIFNYRGDIKDRAKWMDYLGIKVSFVKGQGEQKPADFKAEHFYVSKVDGKIHDMTYNPANKVEPKFHEGEWITHNTANFVFKIINVGSIGYDVVNRENYKKTISFDNEDNYHLWTIEDAKDGDVLCGYPEADYPWIGIFHKLNTEGTFSSYCFLQAGQHGKFCPPSGENIFGRRNVDDNTSKYVVPATKEQRDTLEKAMSDAGYTFDFEKKELKKIEQNPAKCSGDEQNQDVSRQINPSNYINDMGGNGCYLKNKLNNDESLVDEQVRTFCNITKEMCELYAKKNHDYGNSFDEGCDKLGVNYPLGRMLDKMNRLIACMGKEDKMQVNESIEDTLTDLGCYSIMTLSYLKRKKNG